MAKTKNEAPPVTVEMWPLANLTPNPRNARVHSPEQVEQIVRSITEFGFTNPILIDEDGTIVAGHGRSMAARKIFDGGGSIKLPSGKFLAPGDVPVIVAAGWTDEQRRAYTIADNQIALNATWDDDLLRLELGDLKAEDYDLSLMGIGAKSLGELLDAPPPEPEPDQPKGSLADRFGIPPFSVMRAAEGWWQDRKRAWLALGIESELGRGEQLIPNGGGSEARADTIRGGARNAGRVNDARS